MKATTIHPAISAAMLKGPASGDGGKALKASAADLSPGLHRVEATVRIEGVITKGDDYSQTRTTVDRKAMANVFNWALQRMTQAEYDALTRDLDAIMAGDLRSDTHADRVSEIEAAVSTVKQVKCAGPVSWSGRFIVDDMEATETDAAGAKGMTLVIGGAK